MRWSPRAVRIGVIASFAIPALIILVSGALRAQPRPPIVQPPRPPIIQPPKPPVMQPPVIPPVQPPVIQPPVQPPIMQPPRLERVWICSKCRGELGTGAFPPGICPHCGVRIINGHGPANPPVERPHPNPNFVPPHVELEPQAPPGVHAVGVETEPDDPAQRRQPRSSNGLIIALIFGAVFFIVLAAVAVGVGVYLTMIRKHKSDNKKRRVRRY
jgi:hypothetical protein